MDYRGRARKEVASDEASPLQEEGMIVPAEAIFIIVKLGGNTDKFVPSEFNRVFVFHKIF